MRQRSLLVALACAFLALPALAVQPDPVGDLRLSAPAKAPQLHVVLTWTTPANALAFEIRYSRLGPITMANYDSASIGTTRTVSGVALTPIPGTEQSVEIVGLQPNERYWFAIKSRDLATFSLISNVPDILTAKYEGYGFNSKGGGAMGDGSTNTDYLCRVTTPNDTINPSDGVTSLRECLYVSGRGQGCTRPLTVVFPTSMTITLNYDSADSNTPPGGTSGDINWHDGDIRLDMRRVPEYGNSDDCRITIDGSTAPSPGVTITKPQCSASPSCPADFDCLKQGEFLIGDENSPITTHIIVDYLRFEGAMQTHWAFCGGEDTTTIGLQYGISDIVFDHLTVIRGTDSSPDIYSGNSPINRISYSNLLIAWSSHPVLIAGSGGVTPGTITDVSIFRSVIARFGQRGPEIRGRVSNMDFRNNIIYDWSSTWTGIGTGDGTNIEPAGGIAPTINIINNQWKLGPGFSAFGDVSVLGLFYGSAAEGSGNAGFDASDGGAGGNWPSCTRNACSDCPPQSFVLTNSLMGNMWTGGNIWSQNPQCDAWSTASGPRTVSLGSEVTTVDAAGLAASILPGVGTHYRTALETALLSEIAPIGGAVCGNAIVEGSETCDDGNTSVTACVYGDAPTYAQVCDSDCIGNVNCASPMYCGDGIINGLEQCEGALLNGATCESLSLPSGTLACNPCVSTATPATFNTSACIGGTSTTPGARGVSGSGWKLP